MMEQRILECNAMCDFLESMGENSVIGLDTEGTNANQDYRDGRGWGTGISLAINVGGIMAGGYYPYRHPSKNLSDTEQYRLSNAIRNYKGWIVCHNAKFDLVCLSTLGIDYQGKYYDTMLLCHLLDETIPYAKTLNACASYYLGEGYVKDDEYVKVCVAALNGRWDLVPANIMAPYAFYDAILTLLLFEKIEPLVFAEVPREYWEHKQKFVRCLINMERRGIRVDTELCKHMAAIGETQMDETLDSLDLNPGSSKDQYALFIETLNLPILKMSGKTGKPSFDKSVMKEYEEILERRDGDTTAEIILTYRGWQKAVSSNYKPYVALLSPDGRLRCNYKMHSTKTGRLSCERPNLQQIPKVSNKPWNGQMKACFIPMDGYTLISFDYSQIELRLAAAYGKQENLLEIFRDPTRDVFTEMSKELEFSRSDTKTLTYSIQFGAGANRISNVFGVSLFKGGLIRDQFWNTYPGIKKVSDMASNICKHKGKVQLWSGRYRHFRFPKQEGHKAFNAVCQGGAADILNKVMVRLFEEVDDEQNCRMLLAIHDEVVFEIKTELLDDYLPRIKKVMEDITPDFGVPFAVQSKVWGSD